MDPVLLYHLLHHYPAHPEDGAELGTSTVIARLAAARRAQRRSPVQRSALDAIPPHVRTRSPLGS
jgi:hypothetical protein